MFIYIYTHMCFHTLYSARNGERKTSAKLERKREKHNERANPKETKGTKEYPDKGTKETQTQIKGKI